MQLIRNKKALVTGAASGIGRAIAIRLAREGADLYLLDVDEAGLSQVVAEGRRLGVNVIGRYCDVSQSQQIVASTEYILDRWAGVDILVNNAGIGYFGKTEQMTAEHCEHLLAINLHAPIHFTRELLPTLLARPEAHVMNVASFFGLVGTRRVAVYTSSKFGLVGFSESLRAEYGKLGLGVTALCPGFVNTNLFSAAPLGEDQNQPKRPPAWLLTTPEKIADHAIRAIYRDSPVAIPQFYAKLAHLGKRLLPGLYDWANHVSRNRKKRDELGVAAASPSQRRRAA